MRFVVCWSSWGEIKHKINKNSSCPTQLCANEYKKLTRDRENERARARAKTHLPVGFLLRMPVVVRVPQSVQTKRHVKDRHERPAQAGHS